MAFTLIFTSQIPSGKNQILISCRNGRPHKYPDKRFVAWRAEAAFEICVAKRSWLPSVQRQLPLTGPVRMTVSYREVTPVPARGTRDVSGMCDAIQHVLELAQVLRNDGQIKSMAWEHPWRTTGPCAIVTLEEL